MQMIAENHFEAIEVLYPSRRHAHKYMWSDDDIHWWYAVYIKRIQSPDSGHLAQLFAQIL